MRLLGLWCRLKSWMFCRNGLLHWEEVIRKIVAGIWSERRLIQAIVRKRVAGTQSSRKLFRM